MRSVLFIDDVNAPIYRWEVCFCPSGSQKYRVDPKGLFRHFALQVSKQDKFDVKSDSELVGRV